MLDVDILGLQGQRFAKVGRGPQPQLVILGLSDIGVQPLAVLDHVTHVGELVALSLGLSGGTDVAEDILALHDPVVSLRVIQRDQVGNHLGDDDGTEIALGGTTTQHELDDAGTGGSHVA